MEPWDPGARALATLSSLDGEFGALYTEISLRCGVPKRSFGSGRRIGRALEVGLADIADIHPVNFLRRVPIARLQATDRYRT